MTERDAAPVIVIDPGHGGLDGGAVSVNGTAESEINWKTARRLRDLLAFFGMRTTMTRDRYEIDYPPEVAGIAQKKKWDTRHRAEIVNSVSSAVLLSIHQNYYPSAQPHGAQVLYAPDEISRRLGERIQDLIVQTLQPDNRRVAVPVRKDVYLMNHVGCPAVLLECGFLSNPTEAAAMETDAAQIKIAAVVSAAVYEFAGDVIA